MTSKRDNNEPRKPFKKERPESELTGEKTSNTRREKMADYLIDVAKFVSTGVIITSLFNDVTNKTILYFMSFGIVAVSIIGGLKLTNKRKG